MELVKYSRVINQILNSFKENEKIIIDAFETELKDYGHKINVQALKDILKSSNDIMTLDNVNKMNIALYYSGDVNITMLFILFALKNDLTITLFNERYDVFNNCIIAMIEEILKESRINNIYFKYDDKYNEKFLIDNQNEFDNIIFIGDYFEYRNLKYRIKKEMIYNNYGFIKGYIDKENNTEEYQKIMKYCYVNNIDMDFYTDKEEFLEEVGEEDKVIIFSNNKLEVEEIKEKISNKDILYNEFPYDNYKFDINEVLEKLKLK